MELTPLLWIALLGGLIGALLWAASRDVEAFRVQITRGVPRVVRGRLPPGFLADVRELVRHVDDGVVRVVKEGGEPRLVGSSSIDEPTLQRLRNAFSVRRRRR